MMSEKKLTAKEYMEYDTSIINFIKLLQRHGIYRYAHICIYLCIKAEMDCEPIQKSPFIPPEDGEVVLGVKETLRLYRECFIFYFALFLKMI